MTSDSATPKQVEPQVQMVEASTLANKWSRIADTATGVGLEGLENVDPSKLDAKAIKDVLTAAAIATDKLNLLTGQPTSRTEQSRVVYVIGNPLRDAAKTAIGRTDLGQLPVLEAEVVVTGDTAERVS